MRVPISWFPNYVLCKKKSEFPGKWLISGCSLENTRSSVKGIKVVLRENDGDMPKSQSRLKGLLRVESGAIWAYK